MRYTLLDLTQRVLESMESDEVNSISDTPESLAVANIVKECYFEIVGSINPPESSGMFKLDASGDSTKPVLMTVPASVSNIDWIKYNKETLANPRYDILKPVSNEEFFYLLDSLDPADSNVDTMDLTTNGETFKVKFYNDRYPQFYTVFDEYSIVFNAYDSDEETTLTEARSIGQGSMVPVFTMSNSFVPDLDPRQFQLLLNEAKATAFVELKQTQNARAEQKARKNWIKAQKDKSTNTANGSSQQPRTTFGRR